MHFIRMIFLMSMLVLNANWLKAQQDSLDITLEQAKALLLKENLSILAGYYDVGIAEAQVLQAKAWNNPYLNWNQDLYSVELDQYFHARNQFLIQVDQVFSIAGKHTNTVKLAKINTELNSLMLKDVLRSLLMEISEQYHLLYSLQQKQMIYKQVLDRYTQVITAGEKQLEVGSIASNEIIRLKSEQIALQTEALQNTKEIEVVMAQIRMLLNLKPSVYIKAQEHKPTYLELNLGQLYVQGEVNRADYLLAKKNIQYHQMDLRLQKSMVAPDISFGYQPKDRGSNYVRPYSGIEVGLEIPLFNRNTGNIKAAEIEIKKAELQVNQQQNLLLNEVTYSYLNLTETKKCLDNYTDTLLIQVEMLNNNANLNFSKRNLSLLEYIDLQRIYIQTKLQYMDLKYQYLQSVSHLNFTIGVDVIK